MTAYCEDRLARRTRFHSGVVSCVSIVLAIALGGQCVGAQSTSSTEVGLALGVHEVTINGARLWYRVAGNPASLSPPVVFLHGGPGYNSHSFATLEGPRLESTLRMVYFDQRGSGHSERPVSRDYALSTLVQDVEGLRQTLGVRQIALIGHSFGGILALEYAARYPDRVSKLILVSTPSDVPAACAVRKARLLNLYPGLRTRLKADSVAAQPVPTDCELEFRLLRGSDHEAFSNAIMFPDSLLRLRQDRIDAASGLRNTGELGSALMRAGLLTYRFTAVSRLTMPLLVLAGGADFSVGAATQRAFARAIPGVKFVEYDRAGHFVYLDEPDRFARDVVGFLSEARQ